MIYAISDTHALIWYLLQSPLLSKSAKKTYDHALSNGLKIGISSITIVEIIYLIEKDRIPADALKLLKQELNITGALLETVSLSFQIAEILQHIQRNQIPDMPDRIIAATALYFDVPLISRDKKIQLSQVQTIW